MQTFIRSQSGSIMPIFAICVTTLVGIVAVAIAIASDSKAANNIQRTADASALAGATAFATLETPKTEERLQQAFDEAMNFAIANSEYTLVDLDVASVTEDAFGQHTKITMELEFQPANIMARVAGRSGNISI